MAPGPYRIPAVGGRGRAVTTNTAPLGAYRGAGRPEATALLERLVDLAARRTGNDPLELRRRNVVHGDDGDEPFVSATGMHYDGGDRRACLEAVAQRIDYHGVRQRQVREREAGSAPLLGVAVVMWMDCTPMNRPGEYASIDVRPDADDAGTVRVVVRDGANDQGQSHRTTWARLIGTATGLRPGRRRAGARRHGRGAVGRRNRIGTLAYARRRSGGGGGDDRRPSGAPRRRPSPRSSTRRRRDHRSRLFGGRIAGTSRVVAPDRRDCRRPLVASLLARRHTRR